MRIAALLSLVSTFAGLTAHAAPPAREPVSVNYRCLTESAEQKIRLEWRVFSAPGVDWSGGYVQYKGSARAIPIVLTKTEILDRPQGRPWQYQNTWAEIVDGRIAGQYVVVTQGANIYGFDYKNVRSGKAFSFAQDVAAYTDADGRCAWP